MNIQIVSRVMGHIIGQIITLANIYIQWLLGIVI